MTIPTVSILRNQRRRVETRLAKAERVLDEMRRGCALHLMHTPTGPQWVLSSGRQVTNSVAEMIVASSSVAGCGDGLFKDGPSQTWRWWSDTEGTHRLIDSKLPANQSRKQRRP